MSALIEVVTGASAAVGDWQMQLGNEFFARKLTFGGNWTQIRVVVRGAFLTNGFNFSPNLVIGLTSNPKHYNDPNADCVGVQWINFNWASTYANTLDYQWSSANQTNFHKVGNVVSTANVGNSGHRAFPIWPNLHVLGVDILRTATPSFTLTQISNIVNQPQSQTSLSLSTFLTGLETPAGVSPYFVPESQTATPAAAYTGTGPLDSVMVWNQSSCPVFVVSDIAVCRFA